MSEKQHKVIMIPASNFEEKFSFLKEFFAISEMDIRRSSFHFQHPEVNNGEITLYKPYSMRKYLPEKESRIWIYVFDTERYVELVGKHFMGESLSFYAFSLLELAEHLFVWKTIVSVVNWDELDEYQESDFLDLVEDFDYRNELYYEKLEFYKFIKDWKVGTRNLPVTLSCGGKKLQLSNKHNWFFRMIDSEIFGDRKEFDRDEIDQIIANKPKPKTGRKSNKYQTLFIYGIDNLFREETQSDGITNLECEMIRDYLNYLRMPISKEGIEDADDIKNIRSRIRYLRKNGCPVKWSENEIEFD